MFSSEELSFTPVPEIQNKANKKLSWFLHIFLPLFSFSLQESSSMPRQQNYSLFHVMDPKKPFFFQHPFSLSLNPSLLLGQYSPLSYLSICSALKLAHKSCLLRTYAVSPAPAQVLLSSSAASSHKTAQFNWLAREENCQILPSRCSFSTTGAGESSVLPEAWTFNIHIFTGTF